MKPWDKKLLFNLFRSNTGLTCHFLGDKEEPGIESQTHIPYNLFIVSFPKSVNLLTDESLFEKGLCIWSDKAAHLTVLV